MGSYAYLSVFIVVREGKGWGDFFFYSDQAFNSVPFILNTNFKKGLKLDVTPSPVSAMESNVVCV